MDKCLTILARDRVRTKDFSGATVISGRTNNSPLQCGFFVTNLYCPVTQSGKSSRLIREWSLVQIQPGQPSYHSQMEAFLNANLEIVVDFFLKKA